MSGIDRVPTSLLTGQVDALLPGVAGTGTATTAQARGSFPTSAAQRDAALAPPAVVQGAGTDGVSVQTELSTVALALDALSRYGGDTPQPVQGRVPLLSGTAQQAALPPHPPAPALTAPAAADASRASSAGPTDSRTSSMSPSAAGASAALAGTPSTSPSDALSAALAQSLASALAESGLFYESHLAQWLQGTRSVISLAREPQAQRGFARSPAQFDLSGDAAPGGAPSDNAANAFAAAAGSGRGTGAFNGTGLAGGANAGGYPAGAAVPPDAAANGASPMNPLATLVSVLAGPSPTYSFPHTGVAGATPASALPNPGTASAPAHSGAAALPPGIHPDAAALMRQQLDLLDSSQFRWSGQAWPGAHLDWKVEPRNARDGSGAPARDRGWRTTLTLALPSLGTIDAELTLHGTELVARVKASGASTALLSDASGALRERLEAAGFELAGLTLRDAAQGEQPGDAARVDGPAPSQLTLPWQGSDE